MLHVKVAGIIKLIYKNILNIFILLLSMLLLLEGKQANHSLPRWNEQNDRSSITSFSVFRCNFCVRVCFRLHTKIPLMYVFLHQGGFFYCVSSISMKFQDNHSNSRAQDFALVLFDVESCIFENIFCSQFANFLGFPSKRSQSGVTLLAFLLANPYFVCLVC